jgi:NAD(P)-dependent dehydrogenase (short-subunit alcohol dehydrogenase family)
MATIDPFPGLSLYAASKAAMESLTRSVRNEGYEAGIRAFNVVPGAVETQMLRSLFPITALPTEKALDPYVVAQVIADCVTGARHEASGSSIIVPSP